MSLIGSFIIILLILSLHSRVQSSYDLNLTCSPAKKNGGRGTCGPTFCSLKTTTLPACIFADKITDYQQMVSQLTSKCKQCTQVTQAKCSSSALKDLIKHSGVKVAYCNDQYLVVLADGSPGFETNMMDTPNPPGAVDSTNTNCVTRFANSGYTNTFKIPLYPQPLSTADPAINNLNLNAFPSGAADASDGYLSSTFGTYPLPTRGAVGYTVNGQEIFPIYNNRAMLTPEVCEVDSCNEHVGGGGGQPHLHGDPFGSSHGTKCLYSVANYSSLTAHPPQIGWSLDGYSIYGRHLDYQAEGWPSNALDQCGGHSHGTYGYHYHTQVISAVTDSGASNGVAGVAYPSFSPGVNKCWKGNITAIKIWSRDASLVQPCCGMGQFYTGPGISIAYTAAASTPTTQPTPGTAQPTSPTSSPTQTPSSPSSSPVTNAPVTVKPTAAPSSLRPSLSPVKSTASRVTGWGFHLSWTALVMGLIMYLS